jgi:hypothetical protein
MASDSDKTSRKARPSDTDKHVDDSSSSGRKADDKRSKSNEDRSHSGANPPRTTKGGITAPKFGSAGSGGAEFEPGPEKD